jgi:hypothetical protein
VKIASGESRAKGLQTPPTDESPGFSRQLDSSSVSDWSNDILSSTPLNPNTEVGESSSEPSISACIPVSPRIRRDLMRLFRGEARFARKAYRALAKREWDSSVVSVDKENRDDCSSRYGSDEEDAYDDFIVFRLQDFDREAAVKKMIFRASLRTAPGTGPDVAEDAQSASLREQRTADLWEGLRRVYFNENETPALPIEGLNRESGAIVDSSRQEELCQEITDLLEERNRLRAAIDAELQRRSRSSRPGEPVPSSLPFRRNFDDPDSGGMPPGSDTVGVFRQDDHEWDQKDESAGDASVDEDGGNNGDSSQNVPPPFEFLSDRSSVVGRSFLDSELGWCLVSGWGYFDELYPTYFYHPERSTDIRADQEFSPESEVLSWLALSPDRVPDQPSTPPLCVSLEMSRKPEERKIRVPSVMTLSQHSCSPCKAAVSAVLRQSQRLCEQINPRLVFLSQKVRKVLAAKESLFKIGTFVPANDREADSSPESHRWRAGRSLEWFRLNQQGTFDPDWTWEKAVAAYPTYKKKDIGFLFYVYDYKFSGEHRVRLVFDGSRQGETTYKETYAPTVRSESVRLFHVVCVEERFQIGQYDVPQAFLKADIDHDIFAYQVPSKGPE